MLTYVSNITAELTAQNFFNNFLALNSNYLTDNLNNNAHLMLQFGLLVFVLSFVALATPNYFGLYGAFLLTLIPLFFSWLYSVLTFIEIYRNSQTIFINGFKWFYLPGTVQINFDILIDKLSISYVALILSIGFCVLMYTFSYFRYEPHVERLFLFINLFMMSMCILVLGGNLFVLFLGWELIGLTSFFLINFWSTKISTLKAAFKAFIFNKISDLGILIFIILNILLLGESNILVLNSIFINFVDYKVNILNISISYIEFLAFFLMLSAFIKSAQFGFHIWLPDSMEAPVPASALIHSATLVSAGVFLLLRFSFLIELTSVTLYWILIISSLTALGGIGACFQSDAKRILAYSTISHCGFLIFLSCFFNLEVVLLYLCVHGFFKALVFMCVGNVIRFARNYQDFRYMGGFAKFLPFESSMTLIGLINLGGLPFSFGFFIKHYTLLTVFDFNNLFIKANLLIGMFSGLVYSYRLYYYVFFDIKKAKKTIYHTAAKNNLKSELYSNTTLASSIAITTLLIISCTIITYMYLSYFVYTTNNNNLPFWSSNNKTIYLIQNSIESANVVSTYINWFILFIGIVLLTIKFRYQINYHMFLNKINFLIIFFFFIFISVLLLS
jgi:NADH:ubiquinone oxidoreductase subunit 5 (subunit L)/multisubunit Na+/H+ antiporter MnhA subunit